MVGHNPKPGPQLTVKSTVLPKATVNYGAEGGLARKTLISGKYWNKLNSFLEFYNKIKNILYIKLF